MKMCVRFRQGGHEILEVGKGDGPAIDAAILEKHGRPRVYDSASVPTAAELATAAASSATARPSRPAPARGATSSAAILARLAGGAGRR